MVRDALVEEIRDRANLVDICGEFMPLKRVGKTFRGPCPLHGGDDPNFSIDPNRQIFKCFVCGEGGDVFSFLMKHLGHEFPEAVRWVGQRVGVQVEDRREREEDPYAPLRSAVAFAEEWFGEQLADEQVGADARAYLAERGLEPEAAREYALGFAPDGWRGLREAAHAHGIEDEVLLEAGLLSTSERADEPYDRFRDRLVFSIRDLRDRPVGFGGRDLSGEEDVPKYINSPDSPIFTKGRTLYALNWARHAIRKREHALVVEGYTDALSLHVRGLETAVAPLGTALTEEQAGTLVRYARKVFLLYDSDPAGLRATFKAGDRVLAAGGHPMVVTLPEGEDPDSLVRKAGIEALREYVDDAVDVLERKLQILERKGYLDTIEGRRRAVDGILSTLRAASDSALRDLYLTRAVDRLGVRRETLIREVARRRERRRGRGPRNGRGAPRPGALPFPRPLIGVGGPARAVESQRGRARSRGSSPCRYRPARAGVDRPGRVGGPD
jgi:DNA primase